MDFVQTMQQQRIRERVESVMGPEQSARQRMIQPVEQLIVMDSIIIMFQGQIQ
jgi:hypothetical protein